MSNNSALTPLIGMLLVQLPLILAYVAGIVFALVRLPRDPRPATLVLMGCVVLLMVSLLGPLAQQWAIYNRSSASIAAIGQILIAMNLVLSVVRAGGFVLLIVAAFVARVDPQGVYSAFPVDRLAPADPSLPQRIV
jgi:hypothetical protein